MAKQAKPVTVTSYRHTDKPSGDRWKPGYFGAYCDARAEAIRTGALADNLWGWYLSDELTDEGDAAAVQASGLLDRLAYAYWWEAAYLWTEGEL